MAARWAKRTCEDCGRSVLVTADGACPHCIERNPLRSSLASVTLSPATTLPELCFQCGAQTHREVRVRVVGPRPIGSDRRESDFPNAEHLCGGTIGCLALLVAGLFELVAALGELGANRPRTFSLHVRQCASCGRKGKPLGYSPDFDRRRFSFDAHPRFVEALGRRRREVERTEQAEQGIRLRE